MSDLFRLVYVSDNEIVGGLDVVRDESEQILRVARDRNPSVGVTGALLFNADRFAQVLEGPRGAVEGIFERIQVDLRHSGVEVLDFSPVDGRAFGNWSMAYMGGESEASRRFADVARTTGFEATPFDGDRILGLLRSHLDELAAEPT